MKFAGDLDDFSLSDLLQVHAAARRTGSVRLAGPAGTGVIYIDAGDVAHAAYGNLEGEEALLAMLAKRIGYFQFEPQDTAPRRTIQRRLPILLVEARQRIESGRVPTPRRTRPAPAPRSIIPPSPPATKRSRAPLAIRVAATAVVLAVGAAIAWSALSGRSGSPIASPSTPAAAGPDNAIEATALSGPRDRPPVLIESLRPPSPDPDSALQPTVVCRVRVAVDGRVAEAQIYRSRLEIARFEEVALQVVRAFRFSPARRDGRPVEVWINLPISFS